MNVCYSYAVNLDGATHASAVQTINGKKFLKEG